MYKILRLPQVKDLTGLGRSTIYKKMADNTFPTKISLGARAVGWLEADIKLWVENQIAQKRG